MVRGLFKIRFSFPFSGLSYKKVRHVVHRIRGAVLCPGGTAGHQRRFHSLDSNTSSVELLQLKKPVNLTVYIFQVLNRNYLLNIAIVETIVGAAIYSFIIVSYFNSEYWADSLVTYI